jgi:hypothetical protein
VESGEGLAAGLADGDVATGEQRRCQVAHPFEPGEVGDHHLATPDGAVGAVAGAVEAEADDRAGVAVLGQQRRQMGVVVLHLDHRPIAGHPPGPVGRQIAGVGVAGQQLRVRWRTATHVLDGALEGLSVSRLPMSPMCWLMNA